MSADSTSAQITRRAVEFAWDQWTQLGVAGHPPGSAEHRPADPEALLLFTLEIGRHEPRLFDEVLDWVLLNEQLISVQRLRNLCIDDRDRALVDASLSSISAWRPRARLKAAARSGRDTARPAEPLFPGLAVPPTDADEAFSANGLLRATFTPSRKSRRPDFHAPISLALRLRRMLGVGARAEVVRTLLASESPRVSFAALVGSAGYARPNVREALLQLADAGLVTNFEIGGEQTHALDRNAWAPLLGTSDADFGSAFPWIQVLGPLRAIIRWLHEDATEDASEYMRASQAKTVVEPFRADLTFAGLRPDDVLNSPISSTWTALESLLDATAAALAGGE